MGLTKVLGTKMDAKHYLAEDSVHALVIIMTE